MDKGCSCGESKGCGRCKTAPPITKYQVEEFWNLLRPDYSKPDTVILTKNEYDKWVERGWIKSREKTPGEPHKGEG